MKKNLTSFFVIFFLITITKINAQNSHTEDLCLTDFTTESEEQFDKAYRAMKKSKFRRRANDEMVLVPVTYHLIRQSDGTGGITQLQVDRAMERVNGIYEQFGISFYQCGPSQIHNNDGLYNYDREGTASDLIRNLDIANTYNMYFASNVNGACGFAFFPGGSPDRTVLSNGCVTSGTTLEHEIGHSFNLPHTHQGNNENVARPGEGNSNCTTRGDRFCDTEADPTLSGTTQNTGTCDMSGLGNGPDGLAYRTDGSNIMSYAPRKNCRTVFSQEQMDMMYFTAKNNSDRTKFRCTEEPIANFKAAISNIACVGHEIILEDQSYGDQQLVWNWTANGGNIANGSVENPSITYNSTGSYAVALNTSNSRGNDTETKNDFIKVINPLTIPYEQDFSGGENVLNDYDVKINSQSNVTVNNNAGRSGNGLQLTANSTSIYYVKAKKERAFYNNPAYTSSVTIPCLDATDFENLQLKFDLKLLYSSNRFYTTFRILVNGEQLGNTTNLTADNQEDWNTITEDLTAYVGKPVYITFEANTRTRNSNSVYIDNISITGTSSTNIKPTITTSDEVLFCEGESSTLNAKVDLPGSYTYQWKKDEENIVGATSQNYTATTSGDYSVYMSDGNNDGESAPFSISMINKPDAPEVLINSSCGPGVVSMQTENHSFEINWYESMTSQTAISSGDSYNPSLSSTKTYYIEPVTQANPKCVGERTAVVAEIIQKPEAPSTSDVSICGGDNAAVVLEATGSGNEELRWYESENGTTSISTSNSLTIQTPPQASEDYFVEGVIVLTKTINGAAKDNSFGAGGIHAGNQYLVFNASKDFVFKSATVYSEEAKDRTLQLRDENGNVVSSKVISIPNGESRIDIDMNISAGTWQIGFPTGSDLFRNNDDVSFPYSVGNIVSIESSTAQSDPVGFYYYLYDWEIESASFECAGERSMVNLIVDVCTGINNNAEDLSIGIYPNPTSGQIELTYTDKTITKIQLQNSLGNTLFSTNELIQTLDLSGYTPGIYYLTAESEKSTFVQKIIVK